MTIMYHVIIIYPSVLAWAIHRRLHVRLVKLRSYLGCVQVTWCGSGHHAYFLMDYLSLHLRQKQQKNITNWCFNLYSTQAHFNVHTPRPCRTGKQSGFLISFSSAGHKHIGGSTPVSGTSKWSFRGKIPKFSGKREFSVLA